MIFVPALGFSCESEVCQKLMSLRLCVVFRAVCLSKVSMWYQRYCKFKCSILFVRTEKKKNKIISILGERINLRFVTPAIWAMCIFHATVGGLRYFAIY